MDKTNKAQINELIDLSSKLKSRTGNGIAIRIQIYGKDDIRVDYIVNDIIINDFYCPEHFILNNLPATLFNDFETIKNSSENIEVIEYCKNIDKCFRNIFISEEKIEISVCLRE